MRTVAVLALLPVLSLSPAESGDELPAPATARVARRDLAGVVEVPGVFAPADSTEVSFWPQAWKGEVLLLEAQPHGTFVNAGDALAQVDMTEFELAFEDAKRDLVSAEMSRRHEVERARLDGQAAERRVEEASADLARAEKSLEGWKENELGFQRRQDELTASQVQYGIDDQEAELNQLESMYDDDELVDATEEIVLQRARRQLAQSRARQALIRDRQQYTKDYERALETQRRAEAVESKRSALEDLRRKLQLDAEARRDTLARGEVALAKKRRHVDQLDADRESLMLLAPRAGVLLHGGVEAFRPGATRPDHLRGGRLAARTPLFTIADPDRVTVRLAIPESKLEHARDGMGVQVEAQAGTRAFVGTLALARYPSAAAGSEAQFDGLVSLEGRSSGVVVGMHAQVVLGAGADESRLVLPVAAVHQDEDVGAWCWVRAESGSFERTSIELGERYGSEVVVEGTLSEGQDVLLGQPGQ